MARTLRLPDDIEEAVRKLAKLHERSENAEVIVALRQYIRSQQRCVECNDLADVECNIGKCAPTTWYCSFHYGEAHAGEDERE